MRPLAVLTSVAFLTCTLFPPPACAFFHTAPSPSTSAYDAVDNLTSQTDARGVVTSFTYDALNRLTRKEYDDAVLTSHLAPVTYTYDNPAKAFSKGKLTEITDGSGSSGFAYDQLGRLVKESKTLDGTTSTIQRTYDLLGRLLTLTSPNTNVAAYTYNAQGGLETIALDSPVTGHSSLVTDIQYNAAGQLTKIRYGNGTVSDYTYHPQTLRLSQLETRNSQLETLQNFSYTFDPIGNVTAITDRVHTGTQSFQYDKLNRLTQATGSYGTSAYAYDPLGNMTQKEGVTMTYGLPNGSKPHAVTAVHSPSSIDHRLSYDANGNMIEKAIDYGLSTMDSAAQRLTYDAENRLIEVTTAPEATVTLQLKPGQNFFSLPVIPNDNQISTLFPTFAQDLEWIGHFNAEYNNPYVGHYQFYVGQAKFDDFTTLEYGKGYQAYCTNPNGLTIQITGTLPTSPSSLTLLPEWHLLPAIAVDGPQPVSWLLQGLDYDQVKRWNATTQQLEIPTQILPGESYFVHVVSASLFTPPLPRDVTTRFVYDGDGGRVKQLTAAGTTTFLGPSYEIAPDGKTTTYLFAGSQRIAAIDTPPGSVALNRAPPTSRWVRWLKDSWHALAALLDLPVAEAAILPANIRFYHPDHLGSTNLVTDGAGAVVELTEHTPYGSLSRHEGTATVSQKFTGQRLDASTGLYFYHARYYDPQVGRFVSPDPFVQDPSDPQTFNRYSYVANNPVNFVDPSGYSFWSALSHLFENVLFSRNGSRSTLFLGPVVIGVDLEKKEVFVGLGVPLPGGSAQVGLFYNWERQQAGVYAGVYAGDQDRAEGRLYYDFRENQVGASIDYQSATARFFANTDGQRSLNVGGQDVPIKAAKASAESFGVSPGPAAYEIATAFLAPNPNNAAVLQLMEGVGWMAVGGVFTAGAVGGTVASGGVAVEVAAPLAVGGAALALAGALQVSYAVRGPEAYPGRTQGKITRELNKTWQSLTYGGPGKLVGPGPFNISRLSRWQKFLYYALQTAKAFGPTAENLGDLLK